MREKYLEEKWTKQRVKKWIKSVEEQSRETRREKKSKEERRRAKKTKYTESEKKFTEYLKELQKNIVVIRLRIGKNRK